MLSEIKLIIVVFDALLDFSKRFELVFSKSFDAVLDLSKSFELVIFQNQN